MPIPLVVVYGTFENVDAAYNFKSLHAIDSQQV